MVKALSFKGDKKPRKRKRALDTGEDASEDRPTEKAPAHTGTDDDTWVTAEHVTDIAGPIIILPATTPVACLATDANGQIFCSEVENVVEEDALTAEPHDVRQVWVANRVAGTEYFSLKGYLSCDKFGILTANKEAISSEESFNCIEVPDVPGAFSIQTQRENFLSVAELKASQQVRGDAESIGFNTTFRIRMQARYKPKLKASKEEKAREKISRKELEEAVGRSLDDEEVKKLKRARRSGNYHETLLDVKVKGKHDKFA